MAAMVNGPEPGARDATPVTERSTVVWLLTDNKPGHRNQLKGLGNRLRVLAGVSLHWLHMETLPVPLWRALLGVSPVLPAALPAPDLVIGAGGGTHRLLLALRHQRKLKTVVLMKPGFPVSLVDAAIIPRHDNVAPRPGTLVTEGVLNAITPLAQLTTKPEALALIGGPSRHYDWQDDAVYGQLVRLLNDYPTWRWTISGSRRTPRTLLDRLLELQGRQVTVVDPDRTHEGWLAHQLAASRAVWVTPDSSSMVCEAATSKVPTGLFELPPRPGSRVARGVGELIRQGFLWSWPARDRVMAETPPPAPGLWEADRAARWLLTTVLKRAPA